MLSVMVLSPKPIQADSEWHQKSVAEEPNSKSKTSNAK